MRDKRTCPQCGTERSDGALGGLCPKCLVRFSFMELEEGDDASEPAAKYALPTLPGEFGDYEVLEEIAHGGMGIVYRARQKSLHRTVALKMVTAGQLASRSAVRRFKTEAEAAANLDHPNIVPIFEIGEHNAQHYYTMKLVEGASLAERLAEFSLPPADGSGENNSAMLRRQAHKIASLLAKVAEAVHYAHQRGILHRDLKPGNILIDQSGQPHVTDFGLAKRVEAETQFTISGEIMGTPAYMAPEQAAGKTRQITTAADVFSLGAILYQLLTTRVPFTGATPVEVLHAVIHQEPLPPGKLCPGVPSDLETICVKCIEKDPAKRYASAGEVAQDLHRFERGEPIQARPVSRTEKIWRWSRRNPALAGFAAATLVLLITVALGAPIAVWREAGLRRHAEAEAGKSAQVAQFLKNMLEGIGPSVALGRDTALLQEIMDKTVERVGADLASQPDVKAELLQTLGEVAFLLSDYEKAENWFRQAIQLREQFFGEEHAELANSLDALALALYGQNRFLEAEETGRLALNMFRKTLGNTHTNVATSLNNLGITLTVTGRPDEAIQAYLEALTIRTNLLGAEDPSVAVTLNCMAQAWLGKGDRQVAEETQRRALEIQKALPNPHPDLALTLNNLANILQIIGKFDQAEPYYLQTLEMQRILLHRHHTDLATTLNNYGVLLEKMGRWADSEKAHIEALTIRTNVLSGDHLHIAFSLHNLASLHTSRGSLEEAKALYEQSLEMRRRLLGETNADVAASIGSVGRVLRLQGKLDEAELAQTNALSLREMLSTDDRHPSIAISLNELGLLRRAQAKPMEAAQFFREAFDLRAKLLPGDDTSVAESAENLAITLFDLGEFEEAEQLARLSLVIRDANYPDDWRRYHAEAILGIALMGEGKTDEAEKAFKSGCAGMEKRQARIPASEQHRLREITLTAIELHPKPPVPPVQPHGGKIE